jgi:uncharacterized membrane protein YccC
MVNTRNRVAANNVENNGGEQQPRSHPTAAPPLTLEQVQMLQTMQQTLVNLHAQPQAPPLLRDRLGDF